MRLSKLFGRTQRQAPAEADTVSHQLLLRAGMIQQLVAGVYSFLPLGWRVVRKVENIIREEMDAAGGQELMMPVLQPLELWQESGRDAIMGETLFRVRDRRNRTLVLGPTHEEVVSDLVRHHVQSYRDLPLLLYQIQTKFRDEPRSRGGLIRVREFAMKDLYSFDVDEAGLDVSYRKMVQAYKNICQRCGLPVMAVEADSGAIGGKDSQEFMLLAESGEDQAIHCTVCGYAANAEKATCRRIAAPYEERLPMEEISTPGIITIDALSHFLGVPKSKTLKAVFYSCDGKVVFAAIRGDLEINEIKLRNLLGCKDLRLATEDEVASAGLVAGYASPIGLRGVRSVADESVKLGANFVVGANKPDTHLRNANYGRDFSVDAIADIALTTAGDPCPVCGNDLLASRAIEVGHVFKLGTIYSDKMGLTFLDRDGVPRPILMGCYGIGVGRLLAAIIEANHDDKGIIWPATVTPYQVHICALDIDNEAVANAAEKLYSELLKMGVEVLYDDRSESAGVKFNDADLIGAPLRLTVSPRTLKASSAEFKRRSEKQGWLVPLEEAAERVRGDVL